MCGEDPGQWGHSMANLSEILLPVLEVAGIRSLAEVGALAGDLTAILLEWAEPRGVRIAAVDPTPQPELVELASRHEELRLEQATSIEAIPTMELPDAFILDGDHNYFTVSEELRLIAERASGPDAPLLVFHDVCWPHGRRDSYYAPERIPDEYRRTIAEGVGVGPGEAGLTYGGLPFKYVQEREGGERNGVLTAIEDFVSDRPDLDLAIVPLFFGLGVCWHREADYASALRKLLGPFDRNPMLARVEWNRVQMLGASYVHRTEAAVLRRRNRRQEELLKEIEESTGLRAAELVTRFRRNGHPGLRERIAIELEASRNEPVQ